MKLSIIIPTINEQDKLPGLLLDLYEGLGNDIIREVLVADAGSSDNTCLIAEEAGCHVITSEAGRGVQIAHAIDQARAEWLLILHADVRLEAGWASKLLDHVPHPSSLYYGRFVMDDRGLLPRLMEIGVGLRCYFGRRPYGDQGFLVARAKLQTLGGYPRLPIMDDVALVDLYPRQDRKPLGFWVSSSARAYRKSGYLRRIIANIKIYWSYRFGASPDELKRRYYGERM